MKETKDVVCCVVDCGLHVELASRLARDYARVTYYVPNHDSDPRMNKSIIGNGFPGVEVLDEYQFWKEKKHTDLFVFPDNGFSGLQEELIEQGKCVWGARSGDDLEMDRPYLKEILKDLNLPVGPYVVIKGMANLRAFLKENENQFVKVSKWRGTCESFHSPNYKIIEPRLDKIEFELGPLKYIMKWTVEAALDGMVEIGADDDCIDGKLPDFVMTGVEVKFKSYAATIRPRKDLPKPIRIIHDAMANELGKYGYRGPFATELRTGKDQKPFLIDITNREPCPPGPLQQEMVDNLPDMIWKGANGIVVDPEHEFKFGVQLSIISDWCDTGHWQELDFPESVRRWIKVYNGTVINGGKYTVPIGAHMNPGCIIGLGNTIEAAQKHLQKTVDEVKGYDLELDTSPFDETEEILERCKDFGIHLFD